MKNAKRKRKTKTKTKKTKTKTRQNKTKQNKNTKMADAFRAISQDVLLLTGRSFHHFWHTGEVLQYLCRYKARIFDFF